MYERIDIPPHSHRTPITILAHPSIDHYQKTKKMKQGGQVVDAQIRLWRDGKLGKQLREHTGAVHECLAYICVCLCMCDCVRMSVSALCVRVKTTHPRTRRQRPADTPLSKLTLCRAGAEPCAAPRRPRLLLHQQRRHRTFYIIL